MDGLSLAEARRLALAAQGFPGRGRRTVTPERIATTVDCLGALQIDSVNVLIRSHYLPLFSRLGPYGPERLDRLATGRRRRLFEYWGHEASLLPLDLHCSFRWRMERARAGEGIYRDLACFGREHPSYLEEVLREVRDRGPLSASELGTGGRGKGAWWSWSAGKHALEWLFWAGHVTTASRRNFERVYDLPERVLPRACLDRPTPSTGEAQRDLMLRALRALGVATAGDLRDYFRLPASDARLRLAELVNAGALVPVTVEGWTQQAYLAPGARVPRSLNARGLLSPFDSLIWGRARTERLFGFRYRLEIYVPAAKRCYGYYVLPFLLGNRLVARLDLKAARAEGTLLVAAAHGEPGIDAGKVVAELADELRLMAAWLDLAEIRVNRSGDLAAPLGQALGRSGRRRPAAR